MMTATRESRRLVAAAKLVDKADAEALAAAKAFLKPGLPVQWRQAGRIRTGTIVSFDAWKFDGARALVESNASGKLVRVHASEIIRQLEGDR